MSDIKALDSLSGTISAEVGLTGKLSIIGNLKGSVSVTKEYDTYIGDYQVTPKAFSSQILETSNKVLSDNIVIDKIPYYETGNDSNGVTAYIAKEMTL